MSSLLKQLKVTKNNVKLVNQINKVLQSTWPNGPDATILLECEKYCASDLFAFFNDKELVGFINVIHEAKYNFIGFFIVVEKYRNQGFGKQILDMIKQQYCAKPIVAEVNPVLLDKDKKYINHRKMNFYTRNGFIITSHFIKPLYPLTANGQNIMTTSFEVDFKDIEITFLQYWLLWYKVKNEYVIATIPEEESDTCGCVLDLTEQELKEIKKSYKKEEK